MPNLLIDADACPVVDIAIKVAVQYGIEVILYCDTSHYIQRENALTITVSEGADAVDYKIVNAAKKGDIVITNDYGLAAMCLAKKTYVMTANGKQVSSENIDLLLAARYERAKIRRSGGKTKGPKKRREEDNIIFERKFRKLIDNINNNKKVITTKDC